VDTTSDHPNAVAVAGSLAGQTDPWAGLYLLLGAIAPPEELGRTANDGVAVRHLRMQVDVDLAVLRAPDSARDYLLAASAGFRDQGLGSEWTTDVWVDDANRIRRAEYRIDFPEIKGGGTMTLVYRAFDFNEVTGLAIPDPKDVVDVEDLVLSP
jgi:hypothetical protein